MSSCPISNFIGNRCMPDPVRVESIAAKNTNFAEEASFFAALYQPFKVIQVPDPRLMLVLYEQKLEKRKRKVPKKSKSEQLWLGKRSEDEPPGEWGKFEEV